MNIPILEIDKILIISVQTELSDSVALELQQDLAMAIDHREVFGAIIDLTAVEMVDSYISRVLSDTSKMADLMGVKLIVTGIQPSVAITLVEMGITLDGINTALNLQDAVDYLRG